MSYNNVEFTNQIANAILRGEKQMKLEDGTMIDLPEGQRSGTGHQQDTYATQKALQIIDKLNK